MVRSPLRSPGARVAALALLAAGLVIGQATAGEASGTHGAAATVQAKKKVLTGAPKVGRCYDISQQQANGRSTSSDTVACSHKHLLQVYAVFAVPAKTPLKGKKIWRFVESHCNPAAAQLLGNGGKKYGRSAYEPSWSFVPTKAQQAKGAHWVSCLLGIGGGLRTYWGPPGSQDGGCCADAGGFAGASLLATKGKAGKVTGHLPKNRRYCVVIVDSIFAPTTCTDPASFDGARKYHLVAITVRKAPTSKRSKMTNKFCNAKLGKHSKHAWSWNDSLTNPHKFIMRCLKPV
ncbi:MAG TPA: septum formation family protein [Marmoricola sp.]